MTRSIFTSIACVAFLPSAATALEPWQRTPEEIAVLAARTRADSQKSSTRSECSTIRRALSAGEKEAVRNTGNLLGYLAFGFVLDAGGVPRNPGGGCSALHRRVRSVSAGALARGND
jgi:hypothetical protein